jgi:predicted dehydrogenase
VGRRDRPDPRNPLHPARPVRSTNDLQQPGLIIDMGIHVADKARFLLDDFPTEVWASLHSTVA